MALLNSLPDKSSLIGWIAVGFCFYIFSLTIYRLYLSPLGRAGIPGPKIAAATLWYEFYYDVIKKGSYTFKIRELHDIYGPIIRINPYEIHVYDPDFLDDLYIAKGDRRDKWPWAMKLFHTPLSGFSTGPHDHHKLRRVPLNPYFSKASVYRLEPMIVSNVEDLCNRFQQFQRTGEPLNLHYAYSALTTDIITEYCFAKSYGCVNEPSFAPQFPDGIDSVARSSHLNKQFGWLMSLMKMMPVCVAVKLNPHMMRLVEIQVDLNRQVGALVENFDPTAKPAPNFSHPTIFHELLATPLLPPGEKTTQRLAEEGQVLIAAGEITTAHHLQTITYHVLANPPILNRLIDELVSTMSTPSSPIPPLKQVETLPYLTAIILEGFRVSCGVCHRLQRISPDREIVYTHDLKTYVIPRGTPVGMTSVHLHNHPPLFPNPSVFDPERWLNRSTPKEGSSDSLGEILGVDRSLEKYMLTFGAGSRVCLGMNLAHAELFLTLAAVFRRFGVKMELSDVVRERDIDLAHDHFTPYSQTYGTRVNVVVRS